MRKDEGTRLITIAPSGARINIWTATAAEAEALAEAVHEARPSWAVSIDGQAAIFSREGKVVDLVDTCRRQVRVV